MATRHPIVAAYCFTMDLSFLFMQTGTMVQYRRELGYSALIINFPETYFDCCGNAAETAVSFAYAAATCHAIDSRLEIKRQAVYSKPAKIHWTSALNLAPERPFKARVKACFPRKFPSADVNDILISQANQNKKQNQGPSHKSDKRKSPINRRRALGKIDLAFSKCERPKNQCACCAKKYVNYQKNEKLGHECSLLIAHGLALHLARSAGLLAAAVTRGNTGFRCRSRRPACHCRFLRGAHR